MKSQLTPKGETYFFEEKTKLNIFWDYLNFQETTIDDNKDGIKRFLITSDLHLDMDLTLDQLQQKFYSYINYCNAGNIDSIDLGDIAGTFNKHTINDWKEGSIELAKKAYEFYNNYTKVLAQSNTNNYILMGNHDLHPFYVGIDPVKIITQSSSNIIYTGAMDGQIKINDFNIGLLHGISMNNAANALKRCTNASNEFNTHLSNCTNQHDISLIGHYHLGNYSPTYNAIYVKNGLSNPILLNIKIENNLVTSSWINILKQENGSYSNVYEIEVYNEEIQKQKQIKKESSN